MLTRSLIFTGFGFLTLWGAAGVLFTSNRRVGTIYLFLEILGFSGLLFLNGRPFVALNLAGFFGFNVIILLIGGGERTEKCNFKSHHSVLKKFVAPAVFLVFFGILNLIFLSELPRKLLPGEFKLALSGGDHLRHVSELLFGRYLPLVLVSSYLVLVVFTGGLYFLSETEDFGKGGEVHG